MTWSSVWVTDTVCWHFLLGFYWKLLCILGFCVALYVRFSLVDNKHTYYVLILEVLTVIEQS